MTECAKWFSNFMYGLMLACMEKKPSVQKVRKELHVLIQFLDDYELGKEQINPLVKEPVIVQQGGNLQALDNHPLSLLVMSEQDTMYFCEDKRYNENEELTEK